MHIYHLPQDVFPGRDISGENIIIHNYSSETGTFKDRSVLHTNAISLVLEGEKTIHFGLKTVHIRDTEFHFLSAGNCLASMDFSKRKLLRSILIFFTTEVLFHFYMKNAPVIAQLRKQNKITPEPYISFEKDEFTRNYIQSLALLLAPGKELSREMKLLKFEELMQYLLEKYPGRILSFDATEKDTSGDLHLRTTVEANIANPLTLEELAFLCNMSLSTFKRHFTKIYGTSPTQWFLQKRMEIAAGLLRSRDKKPGDIYYIVGYKNHSSFTEAFKQIYGITPREFQIRQMNF